MGWSNAVITNAGLAIIAQAVSGGTLIIDSAGLGGGTVDTTALMAQTKLTTPLTVSAVIAAKGTLENGISVRVQIRNTGVTVTQHMKQVGLFARAGTEDPVLFAIMQNDTGEEIPPESEYPDFMIEFTAAIAVSNTDNIVVTISTSAVITQAALDEALESYYTKGEADGKLEGKADTSHNHDRRYYTITEADSKLSEKANSADVSEALKGKSDTGHTHDDRYYTESETNTLLDDKVSTSNFNSHTNNTTVHVTAEEKAAWNNKAELTDIPTTLPANGGNADTLNGLRESNFLQNLGSWTNGAVKDLILAATKSGFIWISNSVTGMPTAGATWWFGILDCSNTSHRCLQVNSVSNRYKYSIVYNATEGWTDWVKTNDGGNADTVDGMHASQFMQNLSTWTSGDIKELTLAADSGCVFIYSDVTGMPKENAYWFGIVNASTAHRNLLVFQIDGLYSGYCSHNNATDLWSEWKSFADGGNAVSVGAYTEARLAELEARIAALEGGTT